MREWPGRIILAVLSAAAALAIAEGALRIFLAPRYTSIYRIDERYLHALVPGSVKVFRHLPVNGGGSVLVRVNGDGFRGDELLPAGAATRIVVYGDSIVAAEYSSLERTFVERLERELASRLGREVEAVNAGVVGYGPDQAILRMEDEIGPLAPDLVVLAIFADNDFGDLLRNKLFRVGAGGALRGGRPIIAQQLRDEFASVESPFLLSRLLTKALWRVDSTRIDPLGDLDPSVREYERMEIWLEVGRSDYAAFLTAPDVVTNLMMDVYDADVALDPESSSAQSKLELMQAVIQRAGAITGGAGVPLVMLIVPSARDVCPGYDYGRVNRRKHPAYAPESLAGHVEAMAIRAGIPAVNLFGPFAERGGCTLYFRGGEDHWNDEGQALAAGAAADRILTTGIVR